MSTTAKHSFVALDGLRGLAALSVLFFHRRPWFGGDVFFGHAYLAVDFFFMMSGFVLCYAYGNRLKSKGNLWPFLRVRAARLHPLIILGSLLGTVVVAAQIHSGRELPLAHPIVTVFASLLPFPAFWERNPFIINLPAWSLFWEIVVNIFFAVSVVILSRRSIIAMILISSVIMIAASFSYVGLKTGYLNDSLFLGLPRVTMSFFIGVLLFDAHRAGYNRIPGIPGVAAILLLISFLALPMWSDISRFYDMAIVLLLYPLIILSAANANPILPSLAKAAGALSYPIYILHEPLLKLVAAVLILAGLSDGNVGALEGVLRILAVVAMSWIALRFYDEPLRRYLKSAFGWGAFPGHTPLQPVRSPTEPLIEPVASTREGRIGVSEVK